MGTELFLQHCPIDRPLCRRLLLDIGLPRHLPAPRQDETQRRQAADQQVPAHFQSLHQTMAPLRLHSVLLLALHAALWR